MDITNKIPIMIVKKFKLFKKSFISRIRRYALSSLKTGRTPAFPKGEIKKHLHTPYRKTCTSLLEENTDITYSFSSKSQFNKPFTNSVIRNKDTLSQTHLLVFLLTM